MLNYCFQHIPGIGVGFENKLQMAGILTWEDALSIPLPCGITKQDTIRRALEESIQHLEANDIRWFGDALAPAQQWRLFPHFKHTAAYVDIETTGLSESNSITTIALFDGTSIRTYISGENLEDFCNDIEKYQLLVTWNGRSFDAPILRKQLGIALDKGKGHMAHLDLSPVFRGLGLRGGLKNVEKILGIDRKELDGVDGWTAVILWQEYENTGERKVLETLLSYNIADVLSLEPLAHFSTTWHIEKKQPETMLEIKEHLNPYKADTKILQKLLSNYYRGYY